MGYRLADNYSIYAIRCTENGKLYIGRTIDLEKRVAVHFQELKSGRHTNKVMVEDFKKYGREKFEVYLLETDITFENRGKEYEYMKKYNTYDKQYGYNFKDKTKNPKKTIEIIRFLYNISRIKNIIIINNYRY